MKAKRLIPQWIMDWGLSRNAELQAASAQYWADVKEFRASGEYAPMKKWFSQPATSKSWFSLREFDRWPSRSGFIDEFDGAKARHHRRIEVIGAFLRFDTLMMARLTIEPITRKTHEKVQAFIRKREMGMVEDGYNQCDAARRVAR